MERSFSATDRAAYKVDDKCMLQDNNNNNLLRASQYPNELADAYGRVARKLRISVTDKCNMRCVYCMPTNNTRWFDENAVLSYNEIVRLASILVSFGIGKIRVTGGEPLVRPKVEDLIGALSKINGVKVISMTTNGLLLQDKAKQLSEAGLTSVNVSLDSFKPERFKSMGGVEGVDKVLNSIKVANDAGLKLKINTVVIRGWNEDEVVDFAKFARVTGYTVRFIEFMPLDGSGIWKPNLVFSKREMIEMINRNLGEIVPLHNDVSSEPAALYSFADGKGTIGFIPSMTEPFCNSCDRIRITSDGRLLTCLFEDTGYDLKSLIRSGKSDDDIKKYVLECIKKKPEGIISIIRADTLRPTLNLMHTIGG
jgi:cyclic pyranopterin phosphate synthase